MPLRIVYLCGRDRDINSQMSLKNGNILYQLKNYSEVFEEMPTEVPRDQAVYALGIPEEKVVKDSGVLRAWEGPLNNRGYAHTTVQCEIYPLQSPLSAEDGFNPAELEALRKSSDELLAQYGDLKALNEVLSARDTSALRAFINEASDEVLEAMPHIGPDTIKNLREWAQTSEGPGVEASPNGG